MDKVSFNDGFSTADFADALLRATGSEEQVVKIASGYFLHNKSPVKSRLFSSL